MMAATNHSSLNNSETDFLEENLENCSVENQYFLGYFEGEKRRVQGYAREVSSYQFHMLCKQGLALKGVKSQEVFEKWSAVSFILYQFGVGLVET